MRVLRKSGLVTERADADDARVRFYQLEQAPFEALQSWVDDVTAFWTDQLDAFVAHAEGRGRSGGRGGRGR